MNRIDIESLLGNALLGVEKPARYVGGEYGRIIKEKCGYNCVVSFPDLYEIGMSNQAIRILYQGMNAITGVACERVFAPAPDFEKLLRSRGIPLYGLETGLRLNDADLLAFSIGYELCGTSVVNILELGQIPVLSVDRDASHPLVIGGGMALTNPLPFSKFFDAFWIGEAEAGFFDLIADLKNIKEQGGDRFAQLQKIRSHASIWIPGKRARRAVNADFGKVGMDACLPVSTIKAVQDHGVVEIMRGCPNGCRFCHAGFVYRPHRYKSPERILDEVLERRRVGGYSEITLSSLSSGDYPGIEHLLKGLSDTFTKDKLSFQLPSLRVSSFSLPILNSLNTVRKSSLTFAVESPKAEWQTALNKDVSLEKTLEILLEAKEQGWKSAKFYFMIGLPMAEEAMEEVRFIREFLVELQNRSRMDFNVNVGVFVPKPHTPFERVGQLGEEEALKALYALKNSLPPRIRLNFHSPFTALLEGILCRGDERVGDLILEAHKRGIRLEAWEENKNFQLWKEILANADDGMLEEIMRPKKEDERLLWSDIDMGLSKTYLIKEYHKAKEPSLSTACIEACDHPCDSCNDAYGSIADSPDFNLFGQRLLEIASSLDDENTRGRKRLLFSFSKNGKAKFYPHLTVVDVLSKAFVRSGIPVNYTEGFNPQAKLEIAHPLAIGVESNAEMACIELGYDIESSVFISSMNASLPEGMRIVRAQQFPFDDKKKNFSLASIFSASSFSVEWSGPVPASIVEYPTSEEIRHEESGTFSFRARNGAKKDEQALSAFKACWGEDLSLWPRITRTACLCSAFDGSLYADYFEYFNAYYRQ